jgi:hypothetical protein
VTVTSTVGNVPSRGAGGCVPVCARSGAAVTRTTRTKPALGPVTDVDPKVPFPSRPSIGAAHEESVRRRALEGGNLRTGTPACNPRAQPALRPDRTCLSNPLASFVPHVGRTGDTPSVQASPATVLWLGPPHLVASCAYRAGAGANRHGALMPSIRFARSHVVSPDEAVVVLRRRPANLRERGGHFPREVIDRILAQPGCRGLRFYYGTKADGTMTLVFVGIDDDERDMADGVLATDYFPCPPFCDASSTLLR